MVRHCHLTWSQWWASLGNQGSAQFPANSVWVCVLPVLLHQCALSSFLRIQVVEIQVSISCSNQQSGNLLNPNLKLQQNLKSHLIGTLDTLRMNLDSFNMNMKLQVSIYQNCPHFRLNELWQQLCSCTHTAKAQMFLWPQNGRRTVAKARPWVNISVTWEGR